MNLWANLSSRKIAAALRILVVLQSQPDLESMISSIIDFHLCNLISNLRPTSYINS